MNNSGGPLRTIKLGRQHGRLLHWSKCSCVSRKTKLWKLLLWPAVCIPSLIVQWPTRSFKFLLLPYTQNLEIACTQKIWNGLSSPISQNNLEIKQIRVLNAITAKSEKPFVTSQALRCSLVYNPYIIHTHNLRNQGLYVHQPNTEARKKSFSYRGATLWNKFSNNTRDIKSLAKFINAI